MEEYVYEYSLWVAKKDKTESYLFDNYKIEKKYKKGDIVVYNSYFKSLRQEIYLHDDMELVAEYDDDDVVWSNNLDSFHDEIINYQLFYFHKPNNHAFVL